MTSELYNGLLYRKVQKRNFKQAKHIVSVFLHQLKGYLYIANLEQAITLQAGGDLSLIRTLILIKFVLTPALINSSHSA